MTLPVALLLMVAFAAFGVLAYHRAKDPPPFKPKGADEAVRLLWRDVFGLTRPVPLVRWINGGSRCGTDLRGYVGHGGRCVMGEAWTSHCNVSWWDGAKYSETALAHELAHIALGHDGSNEVLDHASAEFLDL